MPHSRRVAATFASLVLATGAILLGGASPAAAQTDSGDSAAAACSWNVSSDNTTATAYCPGQTIKVRVWCTWGVSNVSPNWAYQRNSASCGGITEINAYEALVR
ncbi:hypothetical protein [Marinitenerispora sediminis]|uniref:Uncharacterized protein n=1 Tax=Marinitenerispora sediminis TaxID=1931232 RepID=A0A368T772_9ACTN|nr:hypothetical protein [Marinitenerispora sediminis]RCV50916.1 hypothetical protein DEF28_16825 [Marinitenerispora sediminis]RCV59724.1 hypothetical protein DEF23_06540 [Marinitenerispora sediminis]RCV59824.1 hypothetical protein DEF24_08690 [Marinitenerispora sediminis]